VEACGLSNFFADRRLCRAAALALIGTLATVAASASEDLRWRSHRLEISGSPGTSDVAGTAYSFTPTTTAPRDTTLTFSIKNAPAWTAFNTATGQLSGTPTAAYAGTYSNIVISVSDGMSSASLASFSIAVNQISNGTATVNWIPPTDNSNGTALTGLAGYEIHYGTASNNLSQTAQVANSGLTSYTLTNLTAGTWYFGVTAYTTSGTQSSMSNLASKTIQ
jgi:hypothetical protein